MKRASKCIKNKKEKCNANKIARIFLSSPLKLGLAIALNFIFFLIFSTFVLADGWDASKPSHGTLYADTITSKTIGSPVNVADSLFVVEGITTLGNVGIGTTAPGAPLHVNTAGNTFASFSVSGTTLVQIAQDGGGATGGIMSTAGRGLYLGSNGDVTSGMFINAGNVGIGTTGPNAKLQIDHSATYSNEDLATIYLKSGTSDSALLVGADAANDMSFIQSMQHGTSWTTRPLALQPNGGNVGIGTTGPGAKLHVYNAVDGTFTGLAIDNRKTYGVGTGTNEIPRLIFSLSEAGTPDPLSRVMGFVQAGTEAETTSANGFLALGTRTSSAETEKVRITSTGNVGIGTTGPVDLLHVKGSNKFISITDTSDTTSGIKFRASDDSYRMRIEFTGINTATERLGIWGNSGGSPSDSEKVSILSSGNVGIGTTNPALGKLEIWGAKTSPDGYNYGMLNIHDTTAFAAGVGGAIAFSGYQDAVPNQVMGGSINLYKVNGISGDNGFGLKFYTKTNGLTPTARVTIDNLGNVGIGTVAPAGKLDVSATDGKHIILSEGISDYGEIGYGFNVGNKASLWMGVNLNSVSLTPTQSDTANPSWFAKFNTNTDDFRISRIAPAGATSDFLFITSSGNVGIGNTNPDYRLDVGAKGGVQSTGAGASGAYRNARAADSDPYTQSRIIVYGGPNVDMTNWGYLGYGGDAVMRIIYGKNTNGGLAIGQSSAMDGTGTVTNRMYFDGNGNVGIGTTNPTSTLTVVGSGSVSGVFSKGSGTFLIDHPLDPLNKKLQHSFAESPEMLNIYKGHNSTKDGKTTITMPYWFNALNGHDIDSYEVLVSPYGKCGQLWADKEGLTKNHFEVYSDNDCEFAWAVYAVRHDAFALSHPVAVESEKSNSEKGKCMHEEACKKWEKNKNAK